MVRLAAPGEEADVRTCEECGRPAHECPAREREEDPDEDGGEEELASEMGPRSSRRRKDR